MPFLSHPAFKRRASLAATALLTLLAAPGQALELDVIQYNVQFVSPWNFGRVSWDHKPNTEERARAIGRALACYDIVALNETINDDRRRQILEAMRAQAGACDRPARPGWDPGFSVLTGPKLPEEQAGLPGLGALADFVTADVPMALTDDEIALVTRLPILDSAALRFDAARGTDALTAKGVLHARLGRGVRAAEDDALDVFVTHLQANHADIRDLQVEQLADFIEERSDPALPALILGDLNIDGSPEARADPEAEYHAMMRRLAPLGFVDIGLDLDGTDSWQRRRIDYVLLRPQRLEAKEARVETFGVLPFEALSDHAAVAARLHWPSAGSSGPRKRVVGDGLPLASP